MSVFVARNVSVKIPNANVEYANKSVNKDNIPRTPLSAGSPTCVESKPTGYKKTAQDVHNMYRRRHKSTPDICFSDSVAKSAASWADYLAQNNVFKSSSTRYCWEQGC